MSEGREAADAPPTPAPRVDNTETREALRRALERQFGSFLAHDPHNPEVFWERGVDAVLAALPPVAGPEVRPDETLRAEVACCCDRTTARLFICPVHPERSHPALLAALEARRADPEFMARIKASIEQHRPILDRLAEDDGPPIYHGPEGDLGLPEHEWLIADLRARVSHAEAERDAARAEAAGLRAAYEPMRETTDDDLPAPAATEAGEGER